MKRESGQEKNSQLQSDQEKEHKGMKHRCQDLKVEAGAGDGAGERAGAGEIELGEGEQKVARRTEIRLDVKSSAGKVIT